MKIIFEPLQKYREQISQWLLDEKNKGISNFYYNFINTDYTNNNFICAVNENDEAIGYIDYNFKGKVSIIDIAIVKKEYQKKGIGKLLLDELEKSLVAKGTVVIKLFCEPESSKKIWVKLGFLEFKEIEEHRFLNSKNFKHPWLYKPIVETLKSTRKQNIHKKIELWTKQDYKIKDDEKPRYTWDVTTYEFPTIYPVDDDWKIRFSIDGVEKYNGKIKRFMGGVYSDGDFLILDKRD